MGGGGKWRKIWFYQSTVRKSRGWVTTNNLVGREPVRRTQVKTFHGQRRRHCDRLVLLARFYCEYRKITSRCNRAFRARFPSPPPHFLSLSPRLSRPPWISLIWQPWNQIYSLLWASYTIYRREPTAGHYKQRPGDTYIRDADILIRFRYDWMKVGINGDVARSHVWTIAIVRAEGARWIRRGKKERQKGRNNWHNYPHALLPGCRLLSRTRPNKFYDTHIVNTHVAPLRTRCH